MSTKYDSSSYTRTHILNLQSFIYQIKASLYDRGEKHDASKLESPEKEMYDEFTPKMKDVPYGSAEYKEHLKAMGSALKHHYAVNSHHPEHFQNGIDGMDLIDLVEMFCDWKAASLVHPEVSFIESIDKNKERFHIDEQLYSMMVNTAKNLGW